MENQYNLLLQTISSLVHEQEAKKQACTNGFNLLEAAGINNKEVKMCKILSDLLDPNGTHYMGSLFLKSFVSDVLDISMTEDELKSARVSTEYSIDQDRRIDIVIQTAFRFIPIEVKIYAADQPHQCKDYYEFAKKQNTKYSCKVYYITLDGHFPSNADSELTGDKTTGYDEIIPISFKDDICVWLDKCLEMISDKHELYYAVKQYNDALKGLFSSTKNEEIINEISKNSDTIKAACNLYYNLDYCRTAMLKKLFLALDERIIPSELGLERLNNEYDYKYDNYKAIDNYYKYKTSTYPAITYKYKTIDSNTEIWFRIEVDHRLFCGFAVAVDGQHPKVIDNNLLNKCMEYIDNVNDVEDWWLKWEFLPDYETVPNFKFPDDGFCMLFDDEKFDNIVEKCVAAIYDFLNQGNNA